MSVGIGATVFVNNLRAVYLERLEKRNTQLNLAESNSYLNMGDNSTPITTIYRGKPFFVHYNSIRNDMCNVTFSTSIINIKSNISTLLRYNETWYSKGDIVVNEMFDLPMGLPVGDYRIIKKAVMHCNSETSYAIIFNVPAKVADYSASSTKQQTPTITSKMPAMPIPRKEEPSTSIWPWNWRLEKPSHDERNGSAGRG